MVDGTFIQDRNIDKIPSKRRNPVLADVFARLGFMEREGSGIKKMRDSYLNAPNFTEGKEPDFYLDRTQFIVTFPNMNYGVIEENEFKDQVTDQVIGNVSEMQLLAYCNTPRTRNEIQTYCGLSGRTNFRVKYLRPLLETGKLIMTVPDKPNSKNQKYYSQVG